MAGQEAIRDQVQDKIEYAAAQQVGNNPLVGTAATGARIVNRALNLPAGTLQDMGIAPSTQEGSVVFRTSIKPGMEQQVRNAVEKAGGTYFPDSEEKGFKQEFRMKKTDFDKVMESGFGIPAASNPKAADAKDPPANIKPKQ